MFCFVVGIACYLYARRKRSAEDEWSDLPTGNRSSSGSATPNLQKEKTDKLVSVEMIASPIQGETQINETIF